MKQTQEWEEILFNLINKARSCPATGLVVNPIITPETLDSAAGNHVFDDYFEFWGISQKDGHWIRSVFQTYSVRRDPEFKKYIEGLIEYSFEYKMKKEREKIKG